MPHIQGLFRDSHLLKVLASNMRDGEKIGLHPDNFFGDLARAVRSGLEGRLVPGMADAQDYLIELEELCFGPLPDRAGSDHLLRGQRDAPDDCPDWYSAVVTVPHWLRYLSTAELNRLARLAGVPLPFPPMSGIDDVALFRILDRLRQGDFTPKPDFSLGFPLVWITPRPEFERRKAARTDMADVARDYLGLVHREANEHLIALHLPAAAVSLVRSARPTFADAGRHRRFMVTPDDTPPYTEPWGQTLDLECFELSGLCGSGGAERVCARIEARHVNGRKLEFEYLGKLQNSRGIAKATDKDFADSQVKRDRAGFVRIVQQI